MSSMPLTKMRWTSDGGEHGAGDDPCLSRACHRPADAELGLRSRLGNFSRMPSWMPSTAFLGQLADGGVVQEEDQVDFAAPSYPTAY